MSQQLPKIIKSVNGSRKDGSDFRGPVLPIKTISTLSFNVASGKDNKNLRYKQVGDYLIDAHLFRCVA